MKGPKVEPPGGTTFDFKGVHFLTPFKYVSFARGCKTAPSAGWIRCLLGGPVLSLPKHLLQLPYSNIDTHRRHTNTPRQRLRLESWTVEVHFCAPAFLTLWGPKKGPLLCHTYTVEGSLAFETSRHTWVSVQDVVLKKQKTVNANQVNRSQSSATFTAHTQTRRRNLCSCRYVPCWRVTSLTQNRCGVACWHLSVNFTKTIKNTCRHKKSLHQDMVCLFK